MKPMSILAPIAGTIAAAIAGYLVYSIAGSSNGGSHFGHYPTHAENVREFLLSPTLADIMVDLVWLGFLTLCAWGWRVWYVRNGECKQEAGRAARQADREAKRASEQGRLWPPPPQAH